MTLDEFVVSFKKRKIMVHVHNQIEKTSVLNFLKASVFPDSKYNIEFDPYYQYVGTDDDLKDICGWRNYKLQGADSVEYEEFIAIIDEHGESIDEKSILSLL